MTGLTGKLENEVPSVFNMKFKVSQEAMYIMHSVTPVKHG